MTCRFQLLLPLLAALLAVSLNAQTPPHPAGWRTNLAAAHLMPPSPQASSPVNLFRQLLAMTPGERAAYLTNRPPETRGRIMEKVQEYQRLSPDDRELRLRATELRWWLTPLFRTAPAGRTARLAQVPEDLRELVKSRLIRWDALPPAVQQEFLANDRTLHWFSHVEATNTTTAGAQKISEQFSQFFELTPAEKGQVLNTLSDAERAQMKKTLESFEKLPPAQRAQCVRSYAKFAGMSADERAEFLKNAERWSQMSPQERQSWRSLVAHVPQWPPVPSVTVPKYLYPPAPPKISRPSVATNYSR